MKRISFICILFLLSSCTKNLLYSETAPSWVNILRSGNSSLRITSGDKILFRSNYKESYQVEQAEICTKAIEKNISFIKKAYPFSAQIPMTVELVFFDPKVNDCSTTISVSRQLIEKAETLSNLKGKYEKEIKRIKNETIKVQAALKKANSENNSLENKIKKLNKLLSENQGYVKQIKTIEDFVESAKSERLKIKQKIRNYIYVGMDSWEVSKIMADHASVSGRNSGDDTPCDSYEHYTRYKDYVVCGVSVYYKKGFVTKFCNMNNWTCIEKKFK